MRSLLLTNILPLLRDEHRTRGARDTSGILEGSVVLRSNTSMLSSGYVKLHTSSILSNQSRLISVGTSTAIVLDSINLTLYIDQIRTISLYIDQVRSTDLHIDQSVPITLER